MAKTPHWALFGASERGFDPKDIRYQRKNKSKDISGCWNYLNLGYWRTKTDAPEGSQTPLWFFQGQITQTVFHTQETIRQDMGMQVTSWGWRSSMHILSAWDSALQFFPELTPFPDFTSEKKIILWGKYTVVIRT